MAHDEHRLVDREHRVDAVLKVLRWHAAARERQREPVPAELRDPIAEYGSELGAVRRRLRAAGVERGTGTPESRRSRARPSL